MPSSAARRCQGSISQLLGLHAAELPVTVSAQPHCGWVYTNISTSLFTHLGHVWGGNLTKGRVFKRVIKYPHPAASRINLDKNSILRTTVHNSILGDLLYIFVLPTVKCEHSLSHNKHSSAHSQCMSNQREINSPNYRRRRLHSPAGRVSGSTFLECQVGYSPLLF